MSVVSIHDSLSNVEMLNRGKTSVGLRARGLLTEPDRPKLRVGRGTAEARVKVDFPKPSRQSANVNTFHRGLQLKRALSQNHLFLGQRLT
jgi:hypothetical protein